MPSSGPEYQFTEAPTLRQLQAMATLPSGLGWSTLEANPLTATPQEIHQGILLRPSYHDVLLPGLLRHQLRAINLDANGQPWLDDRRISQAVEQITRLGPGRLMEKNEAATTRILSGVKVDGPDNKAVTINLIDFDHPHRNSFLAINQFRIDPPGIRGPKGSHRPDVILFVNGIPLVVIECKAYGSDKIRAGINDLLKYSNQQDSERLEGIETLFHYNQLMVACTSGRAVVGTVGSQPKHYLEWKTVEPFDPAAVAASVGAQPPLPPEELIETTEADLMDAGLNRRQQLIAGMLHPTNLLDILQHYTLYTDKRGRRIKIVPRYQQFRAVHKAIHRLLTGQTKAQHGEQDQRGGIIWHYQGSGKSLDMVFILRKLRTLPKLQAFKAVVITDRTDLEDQLSGVATLAGQPLQVASSIKDLAAKLRQTGPGLIFGMIQKFRNITQLEGDPTPSDALNNYRDLDALQQALNPSENILLLIDEAHRSHGNILHSFLAQALPNCAKIGFTGTPIVSEQKKRTTEIFGSYIDVYSIRDSQRDGVTVPILYEGLEAMGALHSAELVDQLFDVLFPTPTYSEDERAKIRAKVTKTDIRQAKEIMRAKAQHMLMHYVTRIMPDGFKAQLAAASRAACVKYQQYLTEAKDALVKQLESQATLLDALADRADVPVNLQPLVQAYPYLDAIKRLEFAAVISSDAKQDPQAWQTWTDEANHKTYKDRFWRTLEDDGLAFLIVQNKLLVGFDAPLEQALYVDRNLAEEGLLQAIARTNRTAEHKEYGIVIDYYGIDIAAALAIYDQEDVSDAWFDINEELPQLDEAHRRVMNFWRERQIDIYGDIEQCSNLLYDPRLRAEFYEHLRRFLNQLDRFFPRPQALRYTQDAKRLGQIKKYVEDIYRDEVPEDTKDKIQTLIDQYVQSQGVTQKIEPLDMLTLDLSQPPRRSSPKTNAAEMEHAARHLIREHFNEDPTYYQNLSQKLEDIIERLGEDWNARQAALWDLARHVQTDMGDTAEDGTSARDRAFYNVLAPNIESATEQAQAQVRDFIAEIAQFIDVQTEIVNFWHEGSMHREELRKQIWLKLEDTELFAHSKLDSLADELTQLAKHHDPRSS
ncbi:MAG: HsdR family type I site-specific deoxyribonuclease [Cyanobacteria bacterium P01_A01_bin.135]